ncbi:hypothetical protein HYX03_02030 [Candidatus Woesearchaeota archaeon]|nr:hypothetical protein [Candidatus Woesearchaeota archaeon]
MIGCNQNMSLNNLLNRFNNSAVGFLVNETIIPILAVATVFYADREIKAYLLTRELTRAGYKVEACENCSLPTDYVAKVREGGVRQNIGAIVRYIDIRDSIIFHREDTRRWYKMDKRGKEISKRALEIAEKYVRVIHED